jgi:hypothetical protein
MSGDFGGSRSRIAGLSAVIAQAGWPPSGGIESSLNEAVHGSAGSLRILGARQARNSFLRFNPNPMFRGAGHRDRRAARLDTF